jgi:integrating conjugative element protein (TIGR03758 family)
MNSSMATAFEVGSGVDPGALKVSIQLIAAGVILIVFAWVLVQIFTAYQSNQATVSEAVGSSLKATVILCLLVTVVFW